MVTCKIIPHYEIQPQSFTVRSHETSAPSLTIKHSTAVLSGGGQWFAGGIQFVAVVADADLKLDWLPRLLYH